MKILTKESRINTTELDHHHHHHHQAKPPLPMAPPLPPRKKVPENKCEEKALETTTDSM